jgi:peptidoglycan hydrolase CwlO-like protein
MQTYYLEAIISALFFLVTAMLAYWLKRSDQRITNLEKRLDEIVKNYLDRFDEVKETIHSTSDNINKNIAEVNTGLKTITVTVKNLHERLTEISNKQEKLL